MELTGKVFALIIAAVAGLTMAVQGAMNSGLGKIIGLLEATLIVHLSAAVTVMILLFGFNLGKGDWLKYPQVPWYYYLGGILGVIITYTVVVSMPKLGVANATTAIIVGQVSTAFLLDCFGVFGMERVFFSWQKLIGLGFLAIGARILLK